MKVKQVQVKDDIHTWLMQTRASTGRPVKEIVDEVLRQKMVIE